MVERTTVAGARVRIPSRDHLDRTIRLAAALAVMVGVLTSPIRPPSVGSAPVVPNYLRRNFAVPHTLSNRLSTPSQSLQAAPIKAVRSEVEEEGAGPDAIPTWHPAGLTCRLAPRMTGDPSGPVRPGNSRPLRC
jgi:hypothetical protein